MASPPIRACCAAWWQRGRWEAAALRRSQDRTWEDFFIELCSVWAIPYIGDLVAGVVSVHNPRW